MNKCNRTWIAFANKKRCRHADAINTLGFISWRMGRARFAIGDIVYLFMSDERYVRFKMIVTAENCKREDKEFWIEKAPDDKTYKLESWRRIQHLKYPVLENECFMLLYC